MKRSKLLTVLATSFYLSGIGALAADTIPVVQSAQQATECKRAATVADIVIRGGAIYTLDSARSWADAVATSNGKLVYVGDNKGAEAFIGKKTRVIELHGQMVLPGLHDCHVHPLSGAIEREGCDLGSCTDAQQILNAVKGYAAKNPSIKWVAGAGWKSPAFVDANPNKEELDRIIPDRPVFLISEDGHSAWVNSKALKLASISKDTPNPDSGLIERDASSGEPSGTLREGAISMVSKLLPSTTPEHRLELLKKIQSRMNAVGITTVEDAAVDEALLQTYAEADRLGALTLHVNAALETNSASPEMQVVKLSKLRDGVRDCKNLRAQTVKIFSDGVVESHTAALTDPYVDRPGTGILNYTPEALTQLITALDAAKFQIHIHAIGDRAVHCALDSLESAAKMNGKRDSRHQIAHLQLVRPEDQQRFRQLSVIANFQPYWSVADDYMLKQTEPILGPERSKWQYPIASLANSGAVVVAGSDWPVTTFNPFEEMEVAVTHQSPGMHRSTWNPIQRVPLTTILPSYTAAGAFACLQEGHTGSLEVGKSADLIVLNQNLFAIPEDQIHSTKVLLTLFAGKPVYENSSFTPNIQAKSETQPAQ